MSLKSFPGVFEVMDGPKKVLDDVRWRGEPLGSFTNFFFTIGHQDPLYRMWPMEAVFVLPKFTFDESKRCQFLFILSLGQDGVFQKSLLQQSP